MARERYAVASRNSSLESPACQIGPTQRAPGPPEQQAANPASAATAAETPPELDGGRRESYSNSHCSNDFHARPVPRQGSGRRRLRHHPHPTLATGPPDEDNRCQDGRCRFCFIADRAVWERLLPPPAVARGRSLWPATQPCPPSRPRVADEAGEVCKELDDLVPPLGLIRPWPMRVRVQVHPCRRVSLRRTLVGNPALMQQPAS